MATLHHFNFFALASCKGSTFNSYYLSTKSSMTCHFNNWFIAPGVSFYNLKVMWPWPTHCPELNSKIEAITLSQLLDWTAFLFTLDMHYPSLLLTLILRHIYSHWLLTFLKYIILGLSIVYFVLISESCSLLIHCGYFTHCTALSSTSVVFKCAL